MHRQAAAPPAMLTVGEAAERLAVSPHTVYRLARAGSLPGATRVGTSWRIDPRRLDAALFALRS